MGCRTAGRGAWRGLEAEGLCDYNRRGEIRTGTYVTISFHQVARVNEGEAVEYEISVVL